MRQPRIASCVAPSCLLLLVGGASADGGSGFQPLGDLAGGTFSSRAFGVSADGLVVVGVSTAATGDRAFRWTTTGGLTELAVLSGLSSARANAVSANGAVIVGRCGDRSVRWVGNAIIDLNTFGSGSFSSANGIAGNGQFIVGNAFNGSFSSPETVPYRWSTGAGSQTLAPGYITSGSYEEFGAKGASADGSVVVGNEGLLVREAFRWTAASGLMSMGYLPFGPQMPDSTASAVSADGEIVVGQSVSIPGPQAFHWNAIHGMVGLGDLAGGDFHSAANAVSSDGAVIVGLATSGSGPESFIWDAVHGMRSLRTLLANLGHVDVNDWVLTSATGVSADGRTIVGFGTNPAGDTEGWMAQIPAAVLCYANCDGSTAGPALSIADFGCFLSRFDAGDTFANCDGSSLPPVLNVNDFLCFLNRYSAGCQ
jgi:probable HAF family extracellular repeat protein